MTLWRRCLVKVSCAVVLVLMAAVVAGVVWLLIRNSGKPPSLYYASILAADLSQIPPGSETMSTSFVLSLGVAAPPSRPLTGGCMERATAVQVRYGGKPLAGAVIAGWEAVCAPWSGKARWTTVVASGSNITAGPVVMDALAADARRGTRVFDVSILTADGKTAVWCGARRVGDDNKDAICTATPIST